MQKDEKKKLIRDYKDSLKSKFIESLPMPKEAFYELFDYLDKQLETRDCKYNFEMTEEFLSAHNQPKDKVLSWLMDNGAGCDCEVLMNVEERFEEFDI
ncbi:MAG: DUF2695 domain-containing protein [Clostridia bacterium]|nr:DUF2695 domain-containing protein [Clostridia bacterium]